MADTILIKAGNKSTMPTLHDREIAYCKDEKALYIGTAGGNVKLCDADGSRAIKDLEQAMNDKLSATPAPAISQLNSTATLSEAIRVFNNLIAALKQTGIMEE